MAAELLLVNPRRKRRRGKRAKSSARRSRRIVKMARNPRRKRRRAMSALQRRFFGGKRRKSSRVVAMNSNPRRRRRRSKYSVFRRNPSPLSNPAGYATDVIVPAVGGAAGGLAIDYLFNNVASLQGLSPMMTNVARFVAAAALGYGVSMVTDKKTGAMVAGGAMVITAYDIMQQYTSGATTNQGQGYGMNGARRLNGPRRRIGRMKGMGWWSPARAGSLNGMGRYVH